jgi:chemotaxis methyl-accepting protein methylase
MTMIGSPLARKYGDEEELAKVVLYIREKCGVDLTLYRQNFIYRHVRSRMHDRKCAAAAEYIAVLKSEKGELTELLDSLSINVTHFFRDADVYDMFRKKIIPELVRQKGGAPSALIRIWSAACASGQEPYSLAIMFKEALAGQDQVMVRITATDIDAEAIKRAQEGVYDLRDFRETDKKILDKYFTPVYNNRYQLSDEIKKMVRFERNNLITDEPLKFIDVIFCRNVMIYFSREQQELLFKKFHQALSSKGYLVLAKVETVWEKSLFTTIDGPNKIYQKASV